MTHGYLPIVMADLVPAIHDFLVQNCENVDGRDKPGDDDGGGTGGKNNGKPDC